MGLQLDTPVQYMKGVGPRLGSKMAKIGVRTIKDLICFFPRAYEDRRQLLRIRDLKEDMPAAIFVGTLVNIVERKVKGNLSLIEGLLRDQSGQIKLIWFNQPYLMKALKINQRLFIKGKIEWGHYHHAKQCQVLEYENISTEEQYKKHIGKIVPVYSLTEGLYQSQIRQLVSDAYKMNLHQQMKDALPTYIKEAHALVSLSTALEGVHFPQDASGCEQARKRLIFEEFFYYQLSLARRRILVKKNSIASPLSISGKLLDDYESSLPYALTNAQNTVIQEIKQDLSKSVSMNRLIQGDVGSGKTDVAIISLLIAVMNQKKGAIMAPTEILAEQHYCKLKARLSHLGICVLLIKSKLKKKEKEAVISQLKEARGLIVIGTHALVQGYVEINNLGVVIIDEQHRFGVNQRLALRKKGHSPHCLFMTATPIPRTFMLTCFGDLDKSIIDELPPGRIPPKTYFIRPKSFSRILSHLQSTLSEGQQIYVVYPLIEESEKLDLKSAMEGFEWFQNHFTDYKVGLIHGRLHPDEKSRIMTEFKDNKIQILVATTVIEVGIDVPNASLMIIQHVERFGLSQLHQLRGRIGRGKAAANCYLVGDPKTENANKRVHAMLETCDGFKLSEYDVLIRGPGDILGTRQSGLPDFAIADVMRDEKVLLSARKIAFKIVDEDQQLEQVPHQAMKQHLEKQVFFKTQQLN